MNECNIQIKPVKKYKHENSHALTFYTGFKLFDWRTFPWPLLQHECQGGNVHKIKVISCQGVEHEKYNSAIHTISYVYTSCYVLVTRIAKYLLSKFETCLALFTNATNIVLLLLLIKMNTAIIPFKTYTWVECISYEPST